MIDNFTNPNLQPCWLSSDPGRTIFPKGCKIIADLVGRKRNHLGRLVYDNFAFSSILKNNGIALKRNGTVLEEAAPIRVLLDTGADENEISAKVANDLKLYSTCREFVKNDGGHHIELTVGPGYDAVEVDLNLVLNGDNFKTKFKNNTMLTKFNFNSSLDRSLFLPFRFPSDPNIQINVQNWDVLLGWKTLKDLKIF